MYYTGIDIGSTAAKIVVLSETGEVLEEFVIPTGWSSRMAAKNIAELLGREDWARMRFGIGGNFARGGQVDYVLGHWTDEERAAMPERLKLFSDAALSFVAVGPDLTMNAFNKK